MLTDAELRAEFREAVGPYNRAVLARASGRSKEGAREWKEEDGRSPNSTSLLNMANRLPRVRALVLAKLGIEETAFESSRSLAARLEALEHLAAQNGVERRIVTGQSESEAQAARATFLPVKKPPAPSVERQAELFERKRA